MVCDMPEPREFPSLDSRQKRFLRTHKEADFVPYRLVGLVFQEEDDVRSFLRQLVPKAWILFSESARRGHVSQPEEDGGDRRFVQKHYPVSRVCNLSSEAMLLC